MISNLFLRFSDWNPQFFREIKGRLKPRNVGLTVLTSLLIQSLILLYFWMALPGQKIASSRYCTGETEYSDWHRCLLNAMGYPKIDWQIWWFDIFQALSWLLPFVLLMAGVYMLIGDLGKEERRGTLNFIRLSPQTSRSILVGKLLGVPLIPWLGVALAIPLQVLTAFHAEVSLAEVGSIYLITIAACCFFYTAAVFYAFLGGAHGWLGAVIVWFSYSIVFQIWQASRYSKSNSYLYFGEWFHIEIGQSLGLFVTFTITTLAIATFWNWLAINRRFRNPNQVLLSKRQSYWMTLSFQLFIFGFVFRTYPTWDYRNSFTDFSALMIVNLFWYLLMIAALTPHRQTLLDWARYRKDGAAKNQRKQWRRALLKDLLWGDKSPAIVAIALNLAIPIVLFTPWILSWTDQSPKIVGFSLIFNAAFLLICALIAQSILFGKSKRQAIVATGVMGAIIALPPIAMTMFGAYPQAKTSLLWLFSAFPFAAMEFASMSAIGFSLLAYLAVFTLLMVRQTRQLKKAGESELKALMAHRTLL
ncbi:MAG: hypothetical protein NW224_27365 [Leptolyngbyaceae cyanobacterium bins.302]|nr:hypothetical protein [Leptolyngbyaceae cyanobacterium bins.302]